jgi:hypothetical protein
MQGFLAWAREFGPVLISIVYVAGATWVTVDAVLRKRHVPAIVGWVGLAWLAVRSPTTCSASTASGAAPARSRARP